MQSPQVLLVLSVTLSLVTIGATDGGFCSAPSILDRETSSKPMYWKVTNPTLSPSHLQDLPGFTRSVYKRDHALITPESHVLSPLPEWTNTLGAYLITPAMGSHFVMYLANMQENARSALPPHDVERFIFVVQGSAMLTNASGVSSKLMVDSYTYLPPNFAHSLRAEGSATLVVFERRYASLENHITEQIVGSTDKQPLLETPGEIMDFQPGEFLNVKEVHYNQHGLLLLEGQGIYRLGDSWYPVQAGDVLWMAPFVPQCWKCATQESSDIWS
ncbi:(S)-ureidoglycine aminohydrolase [Citrus sinensis]|nr:(S)-ureidoglycine aminohydrolase [Citrus sinensis]